MAKLHSQQVSGAQQAPHTLCVRGGGGGGGSGGGGGERGECST